MNWDNIITSIIQAFAPIIAAGIIALIGFSVKYVVERIRSVNNATVQMLAGVAVRFVETQFGPDTNTGKAKEAAAVDFLMQRIRGLDRTVATQFVQAAYQAIFTNLSPLDQGAAKLSGSPSASATTSLAGN